MNGVGPIQGNLDRIGAGSAGASPIRTPASGTSSTFGIGTDTSTTSLVQVQSSVQVLLQSIGGGIEDDQTLKMLIGLLILMALLQNPEQSASSFQRSLDALAQLGGGASGGGQVGSSFEFQQTTSITMISQQYESVRIDGATNSGMGQSLDAVG